VTLDGQVLAAFAALPSDPPIWELEVAEARLRERGNHAALNPPPSEVHRLESIDIPGPAGPISCELVVPRQTDNSLPVLIYFHGGGCVVLDPEAYRPITTVLAREADCIVIAPRYRLAPEHPFPAAVDDAVAVYRWALASVASLGGEPNAIAVCGDSAGGYLSAEVTLECVKSQLPQPIFQALVYPCTDMADDWSRFESAELGDTVREVEWLTGLYAGQHRSDPKASPLRADSHRGLAPALVVSAEVDPLLDQGRAYAERLARSDVPVMQVVYRFMPHGFLSMSGKVSTSAAALTQLGSVLRHSLRDGLRNRLHCGD
jgi:acetyl esterase